MKTAASTLAFLASTLLTGCATSESLGNPMFDHFSRAGQIQTALIVGDLEGARRPALWIAEHEGIIGQDTRSQSWIRELRAAAGSVARAGSLEEAATATGRLAAACAGCHQSVDGGPRFRSMSVLPRGDGTLTHMMQHLWAMDRMWEGLIGGSEATWQSGARAIGNQEPEQSFRGGTATAALARSLHEQASRAARVPVAERPSAYAEMITGCAGCHTLLGVGGP